MLIYDLEGPPAPLFLPRERGTDEEEGVAQARQPSVLSGVSGGQPLHIEKGAAWQVGDSGQCPSGHSLEGWNETGHSSQLWVHCLALDGAAEKKDAFKGACLKGTNSGRGRHEMGRGPGPGADL